MSRFHHYHSAFISLLTATSLTFTPCVYASENTAGSDLQMGSVAMDIPAEMVRRLTPLTKYLSIKTGLTVNFHASPNLNSAVEDLGMNTTQIAYLTPAAYLEAHEKYAAIPLVNPLNKGKGTFTLMIVVTKNSPIRTNQRVARQDIRIWRQKSHTPTSGGRNCRYQTGRVCSR